LTAEQRSLNTKSSHTLSSRLEVRVEPIRHLGSNKLKYVLHINIQGLQNKVEELNMYLEENKDIIIISVNEHWLQNDNLSFLNLLRGFEVANCYTRKNGAKRGGTALLIRNSAKLTAKPRNDLTSFGEDYIFECSAVEIDELQTVFVSLYRVPYRDTFDAFLNKLDKLLNRLSRSNGKRAVICTDCNIDTLTKYCESDDGDGKLVLETSNRYGQQFINVLMLNGFETNVNKPTRVSRNSQTCIDHIITNFKSDTLYETVVYDIGLSDHSAVFFPITFTNNRIQPRLSIEYSRNFCESAVSYFTKLIENVRWEFDCFLSVNDMFGVFMTKLLNCFDESFPRIVLKQNRQEKLRWVTRGIRVSSRRKRELHEQAKTTNDCRILAFYKLYKRTFKQVVKAAKRMTNDTFILNSKCKSKSSWRVIKDEIGLSKKTKHCIEEININGISIKDPNLIAESFNTFYPNTQKIIPNLSITGSNRVTGTFIEQSNLEFKLKKVTHKEIENIIGNLKNKKATGWDEITVSVLKSAKKYISRPLAKIVNLSFELGEFPFNLKFTIMKPIYKKGCKTDMSNYRPIALLPVLSKVIETVVNRQLYYYLNVNNILHKSQYGFRSRLSTISALAKLTNEIHKSLDEAQSTTAICFDLSMAFDRVNHAVLLEKLSAYGVHGRNLNWFRSYLSDRKQKTIIISSDGNSHHSSWESVHSGVPQGSVLGPLLFLVYMNDLAPNISSEIVQFADDTTAVVKNKSLVEVPGSIEKILNEMTFWCENNFMKLNPSKMNVIRFKSKKINHNKTAVSESKILGIFIDEKMNWKSHISYISKKLIGVCYNMRRLFGITSLEVRKTVYYGYFYPTMNYGVVLWGSSVDVDVIFKLQKRVVRNMLGVTTRTSCRPLFRNLQFLTLPCIFIYETIVCVMSNLDLYSPAGNLHEYNTRNRKMLLYPRHRTTLYESSPFYIGMKLYNKIRDHIDMTQNIKIIKSSLRNFLVKKAYYSVKDFLNDSQISDLKSYT
jgi:hypothetical protein